MTIEELTSDISKLELMSDSEIEQYFAPVLHVIRPELAVKPDSPSKRSMEQSRKPKVDLSKAREIARQMGIQLDI